MSPADRKTITELHSDLTSQIEDMQGILSRMPEDAEKERASLAYAIDGMSDARFYIGYVINLTRGFYPATDAA